MPVLIPGRVPGDEFNSKRQPQNIIIDEQKIRDILIKADVNGDGCLRRDDLKKAFKQLGSKMPAWRASRCLRKADTNHDGQISGDELDIVVDYVYPRFKSRRMF